MVADIHQASLFSPENSIDDSHNVYTIWPRSQANKIKMVAARQTSYIPNNL